MTKVMCKREDGKHCVHYNEMRCHNNGEAPCLDMFELTMENLFKLLIETRKHTHNILHTDGRGGEDWEASKPVYDS